MEPEFHQSNDEAVLVDLIQSARTEADAPIINPAAYSFTSIAMYDAMKVFEGPIFEVHISNIHARDELHRHSKLSSAVTAVIADLGPFVVVGPAYLFKVMREHCSRDRLNRVTTGTWLRESANNQS